VNDLEQSASYAIVSVIVSLSIVSNTDNTKELCALRKRGLQLADRCKDCFEATGPNHLTLKKHELLHLEGSKARYVYAVTEGYLREIRNLADGRARALRLVRPGDVVGLEALHHDSYRSTVESLVAAKLCRVDASNAGVFLGKNGAFTMPLVKLLQEQITDLEESLIRLASNSADERVMSFLKYMFEHQPPGTWNQMPITRTETADFLGMTLTTTSRVFHRLARGGSIELDGRSIRLK